MFKRCLAAIGILILSMAEPAFACRCAGPSTPQQSYAHADAVVLAEVISISGNIDAEGGAIATLRVDEAWKSGVPATFKVESRSTCAFDFKAGHRYLVYLSHSGSRAAYSTNICAGNLLSSQATDAVNWLRAHATPASN